MNLSTKPKKECRDAECTETFVQYNSLQKYCSPQCKIKNERKPAFKKRKRIKARSEKRIAETGLYMAKRKHFLNRPENKFCPVFPQVKATEVHHKKGRIGSLYLDENFWLAVSSDGHKKNRE